MLGLPTLLGRTVPQAGLAVDIGEQIDYLIVKNKSAESGVRVKFDAIPSVYTDPFFFPKFGGFDMGGLNIRYVFFRADIDLPSPVGMALWLRADAITGLADRDPVPLWTDGSLIGNDASQAVPANQPTYRAVAQNGLPSVLFDNGGGQWLDFTDIPNVTAVFWVARLNAALPANAFWLGSATDDFFPGPVRQMWDPLSTSPNILNGTTQQNGLAVDGTATDRSDTNFEIWSVRTAGPVSANSLARAVGWPSVVGEVCELIVFDTPIDATKAREIESYLSRKYAIDLIPALDPVEIDLACVPTRLLSLDSTKGGPLRACNPYPFMIQLSEPFNARRKIDTIPIPQRGIYCDWITNSMGGDGGNDSPIYY